MRVRRILFFSFKRLKHTLLSDHIDKKIEDASKEAQRGAAHVGKLGIKALRSHSVTLLQMGQKALVQTATLAASSPSVQKKENNTTASQDQQGEETF
jgi:hypothetical protein